MADFNCGSISRCFAIDEKSLSSAVPSLLPARQSMPSPDNATDQTDSSNPLMFRHSRPLAASHTRSDLLAPPGDEIPQLDSSIFAAGQGTSAIGRERNTVDS